MPKKGQAIPIPEGWKERVKARMKELDMSQNELADRAGITKSSLSATLSASSKQTTVMRQIHRALEWPPPPAFTKDSFEIAALASQLDEDERQRFIGRMQEAVERKRRSRTH